MTSKPINLAVLASGGGTTLQNLLDQIAAGALDARISVVIASKPGIMAIERARKAGIEAVVIDKSRDVSQQVFAACDRAGAELVCLAGWLTQLRIDPRYAGRIINIHPALLPSFGGKGMYGGRVHAAVLAHGCKVSGCTVHFVDDQYDNGPIIVQRTCPVMEDDTPETLAHRVFEEEKIAYPEAIRMIQRGVKVVGRRVVAR